MTQVGRLRSANATTELAVMKNKLLFTLTLLLGFTSGVATATPASWLRGLSQDPASGHWIWTDPQGGGSCNAELVCCDDNTGACWCHQTDHGSHCPAGTYNPELPN